MPVPVTVALIFLGYLAAMTAIGLGVILGVVKLLNRKAGR